MDKKELLDLIDQDSSFMKAFLDEYRQDGVNFGAEDRLMSLFVDMKQSVVEDQIPESLFGRLVNLIRTLEVEKLRTHQNELQKLHNFEKYRDLAEHVFVNSSKTPRSPSAPWGRTSPCPVSARNRSPCSAGSSSASPR